MSTSSFQHLLLGVALQAHSGNTQYYSVYMLLSLGYANTCHWTQLMRLWQSVDVSYKSLFI